MGTTRFISDVKRHPTPIFYGETNLLFLTGGNI